MNNLRTDGVLRIDLFENHFPRKESQYHYEHTNIKINFRGCMEQWEEL
jgi:hypothetical protein